MVPTDDANATRMSFEKLRAPGFSRRYFMELGLFGLPFTAILLWIVLENVRGQRLAIGVGIAAALAIIGFSLQLRQMRRMRCPSCGVVLRRESITLPSDVEFDCQRCRICWTTGFTESDSSGG